MNPASVYMEHGVGLQWHGSRTLDNIRENAVGVMVPNGFIRDRFALEGIDAEVIGTPKLDVLSRIGYQQDGPVAISFHWLSLYRSPILRDYQAAIADLASRYWVIGHGHPRARETLEPFWERMGIEYVPEFVDVVERASVYVCDHSSTIYEWAALDRPVVLMDYRGQQGFISVSSGIRYDRWADIGPHATPETLGFAVDMAVEAPEGHAKARREATRSLYPYRGCAVPRTLEVLDGRSRTAGHRTAR